MKKIAFFLCFFGITCISFWNLHVQPSETNVAKNQPTSDSNSDEPQPNRHPVEALSNETEGPEAFINQATVDPLDDFLETQSTSSPSLTENRPLVSESNYMQKNRGDHPRGAGVREREPVKERGWW
jgi:hypothetical protein